MIRIMIDLTTNPLPAPPKSLSTIYILYWHIKTTLYMVIPWAHVPYIAGRLTNDTPKN